MGGVLLVICRSGETLINPRSRLRLGQTINVIWSVWSAAKAVCLLRIPESQPEKENRSDCSKLAKHLQDLAEAASIRSTGCCSNMQPASPGDVQWAQEEWPFPCAKKPRLDVEPEDAADDEDSDASEMGKPRQ